MAELTNNFGSNQNTLRMPSAGSNKVTQANPNMARPVSPVQPMANQMRSQVMSGNNFANNFAGRPASAKSMVGGVKSSADKGTRPTVQVRWTAPSPTTTERTPYTGVGFSPVVRRPEKIVTYGRPEDLMNNFAQNLHDQNLLDTLAEHQGIYDPEGYDVSQLDVQMVQDLNDETGLTYLLTDSEGNIISRLRRHTIPGMGGYSQFTFEGNPTYQTVPSDSVNANNRTNSLLGVFGLGQVEGTDGKEVDPGPGPAQLDPAHGGDPTVVGGQGGPGQAEQPQEPVAPIQQEPTKPQDGNGFFDTPMYKPGSIVNIVPQKFNSSAEKRAFYYTARAKIINSNWPANMKGMAMRELNSILNSPEYPQPIAGGDPAYRNRPVTPTFNQYYDNGDRPYRAIITP